MVDRWVYLPSEGSVSQSVGLSAGSNKIFFPSRLTSRSVGRVKNTFFPSRSAGRVAKFFSRPAGRPAGGRQGGSGSTPPLHDSGPQPARTPEFVHYLSKHPSTPKVYTCRAPRVSQPPAARPPSRSRAAAVSTPARALPCKGNAQISTHSNMYFER